MVTLSLLTALLILNTTAPKAEGDRFVTYNVENSDLSYNGIRTMLQDSRGFIWAGTHKGLCRYDGRYFRCYDRDDFKLRSDFICSLAEDESGRIWVGTDNGLVVYDHSKRSFSKMGIGDRIYSIARDSRGSMWVGTRQNGIFLCRQGRAPQNVALTDDSGRDITNVYLVAPAKDGVWIASYYENIYYLAPSLYFSPTPIRTVPEDFFKGDDVEGLVYVPSDNCNSGPWSSVPTGTGPSAWLPLPGCLLSILTAEAQPVTNPISQDSIRFRKIS